jgi:hypothetical protein
MMGRNVPVVAQTPLGGGRHSDSKGINHTPHPGTPERNAISKDIGNKRSGGHFQGQTERPPERFVSSFRTVPGVARW